MHAIINHRLENVRKELAQISELTNIKEQGSFSEAAALVVQMAILAGERKIG